MQCAHCMQKWIRTPARRPEPVPAINHNPRYKFTTHHIDPTYTNPSPRHPTPTPLLHPFRVRDPPCEKRSDCLARGQCGERQGGCWLELLRRLGLGLGAGAEFPQWASSLSKCLLFERGGVWTAGARWRGLGAGERELACAGVAVWRGPGD